MENLQGKKAIVTGGAMGIGLATCRRLVREGCAVTIWDLSERTHGSKKGTDATGGTVLPMCVMYPTKTESTYEPAMAIEEMWDRWIS
ncbi:MAG: SDR family NAD(P)-dependent oxidoreductase [Desulfobacterales bacterium]